MALDLRLYLRAEAAAIISLIRTFQKTLLDSAARHLNTLMPGYTHLQRAQPVLLSHHLLAYAEMCHGTRAIAGCIEKDKRAPAGVMRFAGTTFPIDRSYVAQLLGFEDISYNSIDAVSDRDFAVELFSAGAILIMHLSRLAEEFVLWSTEEFQVHRNAGCLHNRFEHNAAEKTPMWRNS